MLINAKIESETGQIHLCIDRKRYMHMEPAEMILEHYGSLGLFSTVKEATLRLRLPGLYLKRRKYVKKGDKDAQTSK